MISVHNGSSASGALGYFAADNYYTKDEGVAHSEWNGKATELLKLDGQVNPGTLKRLLEGEVGDVVLGRMVKDENGNSIREHRPYLDVTFSAPKSVSLLAEVYGSTEIRQAHENAVQATLSYMERHLAGARVDRGNGSEFEKTGNLLVAMFRHNTSRELDPQTHTHALILNATQTRDGRWMSLTNDRIYDNQHTIGAIYMGHLARGIQSLGLDIDVKDKYGNFEVRGFSDEQLAHFSQRREQMKSSLDARGINITEASAEVREKAALMTRKSKTEVDHDLLLSDWQERAQYVGIDLEKLGSQIVTHAEKAPIVQPGKMDRESIIEPPAHAESEPKRPSLEGRESTTVPADVALDGKMPTPAVEFDTRTQPGDERPGAGEILPKQHAEGGRKTIPAEDRSGPGGNALPPSSRHIPEDPGLEALRFAASHLCEREMVVPIDLLIRTATQHSVGRATINEIEESYDKLLAEGKLIPVDDGKVTTNRLLRSEQWLVATLDEGKGKAGVIVSPEAIQSRIDRYEIDERTRLNVPEFAFTPGQRDAVALALSSADQFVAVQGDAGTGKTTMAQAIRVLAEEQGYLVRGASVSGAAAEGLEVETGIQSNTVKMFLIKEKQAQQELAALREAGHDLKRGKELWVVDESSFLGMRDAKRFMKMATQAEAKVVFIGDVKQLTSPEAGKPFELAQSQGIATAHMKDIRRQKDEVLQTAVSEMLSKPARIQSLKAFNTLESAGLIHENENKEELFKGLTDNYLQSLKDGKSTLIITPFNKDRVAINNQVRDSMREAGQLGSIELATSILVNRGLTEAETQYAKYYRSGDVVLFRNGQKNLDLPRNSYVQVVGLDRSRNVLTLRTEDGRDVRVNPKGKAAIEVYRKEERALSVGDRVRFTRSEGKVKTGEIGTVKELSGSAVTLDVHGKTVNFDAAAYKHWDHGHAVTVHASQGATVDKTLFHIHAVLPKNNEEKTALHEMAKVFGERSFYVGVTRSRYQLEIYTNDTSKARKTVGLDQEKTSSLESYERTEIQNVDRSRDNNEKVR